MGNTAILSALLILALVGMGTGCSKGSTAGDTISAAVSMPSSGHNFRLSLTDAPHPSLSHVIVNVDHVELLLAKGYDEGRLIVGQDLGPIDLLKLRDGVHLPIKDLNLKDGVVVKQFRLILKDGGNYIERIEDNSLCDLKTPSEQQTGLKLIMPGGGIGIEQGQTYSLIVDFDVDHSIVDNKNNCLLKPVLKVKSLTKVPSENDDGSDAGDDGSVGGDTSSGGDVSSGGDSSTGGDVSSGGDSSSNVGDVSSGGDTSTGGDVSSGGDTSTGGGDTTSGGTTGSGSGSGTASGSDSSSGGSTGDGAPIVSEGNTIFFN